MDGEESRKYTSVSIPVSLFEKTRELIKDTGFKNVDDYVTYVLREIVVHELESCLSLLLKEDVERIRRRLKALGYIWPETLLIICSYKVILG